MRVAILHDYLNQYGGAERVLEEFLELFPEADLYTLFHDRDQTFDRFGARIRNTSFLDWPLVAKFHRAFIPLMPTAAESLDLGDQYDLIISASAGFAKGMRHGKGTFHLSYCHTPLRYAWEVDSYFSNPMFKTVFRPAFAYLKNWDFKVAQRPHHIIANSAYIADKVKRYYGRDATIVHPPVDHDKFYPEPNETKDTYYLAVGRLLHYKRFDLVVNAFRSLGLPLVIAGSGPKEDSLRARAKGASNIQFRSSVSDTELRKLYSNARALIFPQVEDFGLVAAEAQACGTPVIAFDAGGAREIIKEGITGTFFQEQTPEALSEAVRQFETKRFDRKKIQKASLRFSRANFREAIMQHVSGTRAPEGIRVTTLV